jgi:hypothetical protein
MAQRLTMEGIKQLYPEDQWIHVLPAVTKFMGTDSPIWGLDVAEVTIDPDSPSAVYNNNGKDALTKVSLDRLAAAAGLSVSSMRVDDRANRDLCVFQASAMLRLPGGDVIERTATREWDGRDAMDRILIECEAHVAKNSPRLTGPEFENAVARRFREEALRERESSRAKTESKAINRAIAMILGIPRAFPRGVLESHRFAVVKYVLVPDMSDPDVKAAVISAGISVRGQLYAAPQHRQPQLQAGASADAEYHPVDDTAGLEAVVGSQQERAENEAREAARPRMEEPQGVRDQRALLGEAPAQEVRADGRSAAGWADIEPSLPDIQALLSRCRHAKATDIKRKYLDAYTARDAAKVTEIYNWLLDQELAAQGGN